MSSSTRYFCCHQGIQCIQGLTTQYQQNTVLVVEGSCDGKLNGHGMYIVDAVGHLITFSEEHFLNFDRRCQLIHAPGPTVQCPVHANVVYRVDLWKPETQPRNAQGDVVFQGEPTKAMLDRARLAVAYSNFQVTYHTNLADMTSDQRAREIDKIEQPRANVLVQPGDAVEIGRKVRNGRGCETGGK